jgi:hypothetical protein
VVLVKDLTSHNQLNKNKQFSYHRKQVKQNKGKISNIWERGEIQVGRDQQGVLAGYQHDCTLSSSAVSPAHLAESAAFEVGLKNGEQVEETAGRKKHA